MSAKHEGAEIDLGRDDALRQPRELRVIRDLEAAPQHAAVGFLDRGNAGGLHRRDRRVESTDGVSSSATKVRSARFRIPRRANSRNDSTATIGMIRRDLEHSYPSLHLVRRNSMHKCSNQDHAMMTAMLTARNILAGERIYDTWQVNEDAEYHEAGAAGAKEALASERLVPRKVSSQAA